MPCARIACVALSVLVAAWAAAPAATGAGAATVGRVEQVTLTRDAHGAVVVVRTSRPLRYRTEVLTSPSRLVLDFDEARFAWRGGPLRPDSGPIVEIRGSQFRATVARVVVALGRAVPHRIVSTPDGLRIAFASPPDSAPGAPAEPVASAAPRAAAGPVAAAPRREPASRPILYGIVLRGEDSVAYMEDPRTGRVSGFKRGDRVGAGVLATIEERHVTIQAPSGAVQIRVDDPKPGGGPPAPRIEVGPGATRP